MAYLTINGQAMPCPVQLAVGEEIIWSANTGRTDSGKMVGDVVAEKTTLNITWGILTETEYAKIKNNIKPGFFSVTFRDAGQTINWNGYRGSLSNEQLGYIGDGIFYYKSTVCQIIQQ